MWFNFVGAVIIVATGLLVVCKRNVSMGHAALTALGVALIMVPQLSNLELSPSSLKVTTRAQGEELTNKVEDTNQQLQTIESRLEKITQALEENSRRIAALEVNVGVSPDTGNGMWMPGTYDKNFFDDLLKQNEAAKVTTAERIQELEQFKKTFQPEVWNGPVN